MIKFGGRLVFHPYMSAKHTKYGIKVWMRSDHTNGYNNEFQIYTGKSDGRREVGLAERVGPDLSRKPWNVENDFYKLCPILTNSWECNIRQRDNKNKSHEVSKSSSFTKCYKGARTIPNSSAWGIHSCCLNGQKAQLFFCPQQRTLPQLTQKWSGKAEMGSWKRYHVQPS